mgnify:CR=1 FL=1|jgi:aryl-alcohol dehydrogenase-like predicted oxidoreductase
MQYRKLGNTNIDIPIIGLGTMTWGQQNTFEEGYEQMDYALSRGVNFFDAAEMYPVPPRAETYGDTERCIGKWFAQTGRRDDVTLATKVSGRSKDMTHVRGGPRLSRDHIRKAIEGSLERLQTDYIDLYQVHWPERATNFFGKRGYSHYPAADGVAIDQTLDALNELVDEGLVKNIGISNETPWGAMEYLRLASERGWSKIVSIQNVYNLLSRQFEVGLAEIALREDVGLLAYSPLAFGVLTGKYIGGVKPKGSRLALFERFSRYDSLQSEAATAAYFEIAKEHGLSLTQMSLAFVCQQPFVTSCLIGATDMNQLRENIDAFEINLPKEILLKIEEVQNQYPDPAP